MGHPDARSHQRRHRRSTHRNTPEIAGVAPGYGAVTAIAEDEMTTPIEDVVARSEIHAVLMRYCRALDRMDRELASTVWHPNGTADYGGYFEGTGEAFLDWVWEGHARLDAHAHQITNVLIEVDGDRAASESYVTVVLRGNPAGTGTYAFAEIGRYLDRWERREGRWAIVARVYVADLPDFAGGGATFAESRSRRDRSDPSYTFAGGTVFGA
jgi:hypothetical protein